MNKSGHFWTAKHTVAATCCLVAGYLVWIGPERFYIESYTTLIVSPAIYPRLLPAPWKGWLVSTLVYYPWTCLVLQAVPVLMLVAAFAAGVLSLLKNSLLLAGAFLGLTFVVFFVYHFLQPFGMTLRTF